MLEDAVAAAVQHRRVEEICASDPAIESLEVAPDANEDDLLAPVGMGLTRDLRIDQPFVLACVVQCLLGLGPKDIDLPGLYTALKDPNYQAPTPAGSSETPVSIFQGGGRFGNYRAISAARYGGEKRINAADERTQLPLLASQEQVDESGNGRADDRGDEVDP